MGLQKYKREIARQNMIAAGIGNVNRKMARRNSNGIPFWRGVLEELRNTSKRETKRGMNRKIRRAEHE